jgi:hypothetical protein
MIEIQKNGKWLFQWMVKIESLFGRAELSVAISVYNQPIADKSMSAVFGCDPGINTKSQSGRPHLFPETPHQRKW